MQYEKRVERAHTSRFNPDFNFHSALLFIHRHLFFFNFLFFIFLFFVIYLVAITKKTLVTNDIYQFTLNN